METKKKKTQMPNIRNLSDTTVATYSIFFIMVGVLVYTLSEAGRQYLQIYAISAIIFWTVGISFFVFRYRKIRSKIVGQRQRLWEDGTHAELKKHYKKRDALSFYSILEMHHIDDFDLSGSWWYFAPGIIQVVEYDLSAVNPNADAIDYWMKSLELIILRSPQFISFVGRYQLLTLMMTEVADYQEIGRIVRKYGELKKQLYDEEK